MPQFVFTSLQYISVYCTTAAKLFVLFVHTNTIPQKTNGYSMFPLHLNAYENTQSAAEKSTVLLCLLVHDLK